MMDKLGEFLERDLRVRKKAKAALTYPAFILVFCILVIAGIFMFVLPGLLDVFSQMASGELPVPTRVMFMIVSLARNPYVFLGLFLAVLYYLVYFQDYLKTPTGKYKFDRLKTDSPLVRGHQQEDAGGPLLPGHGDPAVNRNSLDPRPGNPDGVLGERVLPDLDRHPAL